MFGPMAKWVAQIDRADRIPELVARAFSTACAGRPGPVVLALPEDMLAAEVDVADAPRFHRVQPQPARTKTSSSSSACSRARSGRSRSSAGRMDAGGLRRTWRRSSRRTSCPAGAAFRRQDTLDNDYPRYVGDVGIGINPKLAQRVRDADLLLVVGPRLGEMTTSGYTLLDVPGPKQTLVHVHPGAEELGRVYQPALPILASPESFAAAVAELRVDAALARLGSRGARGLRGVAATRPDAGRARPRRVHRAPARAGARTRSSPTARATTPSGSTASGASTRYPTQLAPTSGAMGYGVPAAVAAKAVAPDRTVVCFSGDGDFLMIGQELATAVQYELPIVVLVVNNGMYGTIRMHQERQFPGRVVGTDLVNPDFAAYARAFGAHGEKVTGTDEFPDALERALAAGTPAVLALRIDPEAITPRTTLSAVRAQAPR